MGDVVPAAFQRAAIFVAAMPRLSWDVATIAIRGFAMSLSFLFFGKRFASSAKREPPQQQR